MGKTATAAVIIMGMAFPEIVESGVRKLLAQGLAWVQRTPVVITGRAHPLTSMEVERYSSLQAALAENHPIMAGIIDGLNRPGFRRFEVNPAGSVFLQKGVYALRPRLGFEMEFREFGFAALERLRIYEVHVPGTWSASLLNTAKKTWASDCNVPLELIDLWSEFVPRRGLKRVNECRPGGRCLIVTEGCNQSILNQNNVEV
ncbi:MAG TPA: hypothetical protein VEX86_11680 [Longimicrobium sp.]|nr:hypothetical protein [Longimicrobium sp.]